MKCVLTDKLIREFELSPTQRRLELVDQKVKGFYAELRATSPGEASFYLRWKNSSGKTCHKHLGKTELIDVATGRQRAAKLKLEIEAGRDPHSEEIAKKQVLTWTELFEQWYLPHSQQHLRSWAYLEEMHRLRIKERFGHVKLNKITRHAVQQFHNDLRVSGLSPASCDHHLKLIRQALNIAVSWELLESNPVARIQLFNEDNRVEHVMDNDQLQRLMATLDGVSDRRKMASLVIKFLLFTGARVNEALNARWLDIDRKNRTWTIQAKTAKGKRRRSVPINDAAMAVLDQLTTNGKSEWLFTSRQGGGNQRMTTINKVWQEIRKDAGLPWLRLHDLRHNFASMLVNSGRTLYEVQQILGHSQAQVTERYAHLSTATLQDAANSASTFLDKALDKTGNK